MSASLPVLRYEVCSTSFLVDLGLDVEVDARNDQVGHDVERAHAVQDVRVVKGDLLARLHHHQDDHEVGSVGNPMSAFAHKDHHLLLPVWLTGHIHLRVHGGGIGPLKSSGCA